MTQNHPLDSVKTQIFSGHSDHNNGTGFADHRRDIDRKSAGWPSLHHTIPKVALEIGPDTRRRSEDDAGSRLFLHIHDTATISMPTTSGAYSTST